MKELVRAEEQQCKREIDELEASLVRTLLPQDEADKHSAILEVRAGAGGQEASLFAAEIFQMYQRFAGTTSGGWKLLLWTAVIQVDSRFSLNWLACDRFV